MWRRSGDVAFSVLVLVVVTLEAAALALFLGNFVLRLTGAGSFSRLQGALIGAIAMAGLGLLVVSLYVLGYHAMSARREDEEKILQQAWTERWLGVLFEGKTAATPPLPKEAVEALLNLREILKGDAGERLERLVEHEQIGAMLASRLESRRLTVRLEALEGLARARLPAAFGPILQRLSDREPTVRLAAARAGARTLASISDPQDRDLAAAALCDALQRWLPVGVIEEALLLAQESAGVMIVHLLAQEDPALAPVRASLDAIGRLGLLTFGDEVARFTRHADPEVRAASFRALSRLGYLPAEIEPAVTAALADEAGFVRMAAVRAARFLPGGRALHALEARLGDESWWVRQAAAESLLAMGEPGLAYLRRAAREHADRFGRDMAIQALLDADVLDADGARLLKVAG